MFLPAMFSFIMITATSNVWDGVTNPVPRAVYKILSILRCAIDDEVIAVLTNFLVFQHEDGGIAAQFGFTGLVVVERA